MEQQPEISTEELQTLMRFVDFPLGQKCNADWNFFHHCWDIFRHICIGRQELDFELHSYRDAVIESMSIDTVDETLILLAAGVTWYESLFKKTKSKKDNGTSENQTVQQ